MGYDFINHQGLNYGKGIKTPIEAFHQGANNLDEISQEMKESFVKWQTNSSKITNHIFVEGKDEEKINWSSEYEGICKVMTTQSPLEQAEEIKE